MSQRQFSLIHQGSTSRKLLNVNSVIFNKTLFAQHLLQASIVGSVVECSPATRAARVRFPDDASSFIFETVKM